MHTVPTPLHPPYQSSADKIETAQNCPIHFYREIDPVGPGYVGLLRPLPEQRCFGFVLALTPPPLMLPASAHCKFFLLLLFSQSCMFLGIVDLFPSVSPQFSQASSIWRLFRTYLVILPPPSSQVVRRFPSPPPHRQISPFARIPRYLFQVRPFAAPKND
ncbi:hypothetical protein LX32DRAFT_14959 [Colletotrichum zoysiae]|uniref:Uncharacterized protein n=1 Tax=Colletotrichum zoysiae TaxID=1216348 RepID=A0AAD9M2A3_9PEZI|nr:hypothetical protein LX32DRAFT_14959 [Colletotrichum zoysiae]